MLHALDQLAAHDRKFLAEAAEKELDASKHGHKTGIVGDVSDVSGVSKKIH
jgi:hypothetical protein